MAATLNVRAVWFMVMLPTLITQHCVCVRVRVRVCVRARARLG